MTNQSRSNKINSTVSTPTATATATATTTTAPPIQYNDIDFTSNHELLNWSTTNDYALGKRTRNPQHSHDSFASSGWGIDNTNPSNNMMDMFKYNIYKLYTRYELITDTYMLENWEKFIFNIFFISFVIATAYIITQSIVKLL